MHDELESQYGIAKRKYAKLGVDVDKAIEFLKKIAISIHCWQGDDVGGFEAPDSSLSGGGIQVTGNYPGKARTLDELRQDYLKAFSLIPSKPRANIHAIYGKFGNKKADRNEISITNFQGWIDWAKKYDVALDFNCTLFSHPKADSGFTLSSKTDEIREFWIGHVIRCREISAEMGRQLGTTCIHNIWIPDGSKDIPVDRIGHRKLLIESLDRALEKPYDPELMLDSIEGKLFGIGSEAFVVGSHDFYLSYAIRNDVMLTMDMGHYHPTESVADKISAIIPFTGKLLLHISRGVRWDSDHVAILNDEIKSVAEEIVRSGNIDNIHIALDFFDGSINRIGAWVIGARSILKALLLALLQPMDILKEHEEGGRNFQRLALLEELKTMPFNAVWDFYCNSMNVPDSTGWIGEIEQYESEVLSNRS